MNEEKKLFFENDYGEGTHELILKRLIETNMEGLGGHWADPYTKSAEEKILKACGCPDGQVCFIMGGTQTNQIVISTLLKDYEGVVAPASGHINNYECGAIEYSGRKVIPIPEHDGKMLPQDLRSYLETFYAHNMYQIMVKPSMVYISHPTEIGTLYTKEELIGLRKICDEYNMPLYMDGARLGYGVMSNDTDVSIQDVAKYCDVFYIGGTKVGALCGEALVFSRMKMPELFPGLVKQRGGMTAKSRILGIQFDTLFTDDLYFKISKNAIDMAEILKKGFKEKGYEFYLDSPTNQQFFALDNEQIKELEKKVTFAKRMPADENHTVVRFTTSWATTEEQVHQLLELI